MIRFVVNKNADLSKYGFEEDTKEWVVWQGTRRLWVRKSDYLLHFNMITNETLSIFYDMIKDNIVKYVDKPLKPCNYHYIGLSNDEYKLILDKRNKAK